MKNIAIIKSFFLCAVVSLSALTLDSCSSSDDFENDFTGIWKEAYTEFYVDGVKTKTVDVPYTQYLTGGLGYGAIDIDDEGYPYRNRARLYHQFYSGNTVATYGYNNGESVMSTNSKYSFKEGANLLVINDCQFEILSKKANEFTVKEELGKSLVALLRENDAYITELYSGEGECYVITHYKRVSKLGE